MMLGGCGRPAPPGSAEQPGAAATAARQGAFSREQLIEDARQLASILENSHPDPYINGGGRIAFHRRLHRVLNAIPDEGMTRDEFFRLLRPFVAGVGDAHTNFLSGYEVDRRRPGGLPLRFRVVEQSLVVAGVAREEHRGLLGSRLVSVEGVPLRELLDRQRQLRGIDNPYHGLQTLVEESLWYRQHMQDLIPEWKDTAEVRVELERPGGSAEAVALTVPREEVSWIGPATRVTLPVPDESGFAFSFLKTPASGKEIGYLRFTHMIGYRETQERRRAHPDQAAETPLGDRHLPLHGRRDEEARHRHAHPGRSRQQRRGRADRGHPRLLPVRQGDASEDAGVRRGGKAGCSGTRASTSPIVATSLSRPSTRTAWFRSSRETTSSAGRT